MRFGLSPRCENVDKVRWICGQDSRIRQFLPDGTEVRTKYFREVKVATVLDGELVWEGKAFDSMSQLARAMRGDTSNNAWKVLEVKRRGDANWKLADLLRR